MKIKIFFRCAARTLFVFALIYLGHSFITMEFDANNWSMDERGIYVIMSGTLSVFVNALIEV